MRGISFSTLDKGWYSVRYGVRYDRVLVDKEPTDCDWSHAPLGGKGCVYHKVVSTVRWATSTTGDPIVSYDDGKTWSTFTPDANDKAPPYSTVESASITWHKSKNRGRELRHPTIVGTYYNSTLLKASGADIKVMQELLRHASTRVTLDTYTQAVTPAKRAAQTAVVRQFFPSAKTAWDTAA
jgi:hypothetical protein